MDKFSVGDKVKWKKKGKLVGVTIVEKKGNDEYVIDHNGKKAITTGKLLFIKKQLKKEPKEVKNVLEFIQTDIKNKSVEQILKEASERKIDFVRDGEGGEIKENRSYRGFVYERLWDICIKFGVVDGLTMKNNLKNNEELKEGIIKYNTCHLFGNLNVENIDFKAGSNCWEGQFKRYLDENVQSGNSGGYSDISFVNKYKPKDETEKEDVYFISVKYYEKEKDVGSYDIGKLCTMIEKHNKVSEDRNINILI